MYEFLVKNRISEKINSLYLNFHFFNIYFYILFTNAL